MGRIVYVNGSFLPEEQAMVSVFDRGFVFADGIYEVTARIGGRFVDLDAHLARLERSCGEIELALPWPRDELKALHEEIAQRNALADGSVYLQVTRGAADRAFPFPAEAAPTLVMFTQARAFSAEMGRGFRTITVPDLRWARRDIKSVALLAQVLAKQAAAVAGCDEALMVEDGLVTEGGSSTVWIVKGRTLITRPLSNAVLPGITRRALLAYLDETGFAFEERAFSPAEALAADEAFVTSATAFVMSVVEIDGQPVGGGQPGPVVRRLREIYFALAAQGGALG